MDAANIKGVIDRLKSLNLVRTRKDPGDARRHLIDLTPLGKVVIERSIPKASLITEKNSLSFVKRRTGYISYFAEKNFQSRLTSIFT